MEEERRKKTQKRPRPLRRVAPPGPPAGPPPELTLDLRSQIWRVFQEQSRGTPDVPKRQIHLGLARRFKLPRSVIAWVVREEADRALLTEEVRRRIVQRYLAYVERMERPEAGRRKTIARALGIPFRLVARVVREWKDQQPRISDIPRDARFRIEKAYFQYLPQGRVLGELDREIARKEGLTPWQVHRYLDLIHDGEKALRKVPDVSLAARLRIEEGYRLYLGSTAPPEPFLHDLLAQQVGVEARQVHKVLLDYRMRFRRDHLGY